MRSTAIDTGALQRSGGPESTFAQEISRTDQATRAAVQSSADDAWGTESLSHQRASAEDLSGKMQRVLDAFYSGEITAGMLASNPALQLWVQQALQWENRFFTAMSNVLREVHETRRAILSNIRA